MRGRLPKPTRLKVVQGNPGKRALPKNEPKPTGKAKAPSWLTVDARREWNILAPKLEKLGILTDIDAEAFGELCVARTLLRHRLKTEGRFSTELWRAIQAMEARFGLTPSDRARISVAPKKDDDGFEEFLGGKG